MSGDQTSTTPLRQLFEVGVGAMSLLGAHRAGLVQALLDTAATPAQFADRLNLDPRAAALCLNVLTTFGAAEYTDGRYTASAELKSLAETSPGGVTLDLDLYGHVGEYLVTGRPLIAMDGSLAERGEHYTKVAAGLGPRYQAAAEQLAEQFATGPAEILDVGAGSGVWGLTMAQCHPESRLTAVDLGPVLEVLRRNAKERGIEDRVTTIDGGYLDVDLPAAHYDCVILGNVLHLEPPDAAQRLVRRAAGALRPGGRLVIVDILGEGGHESDDEHAMYALFLALRTRHGRMYSTAEVRSWLTDAGFEDTTVVELTDAPSLLTFLYSTRRDGGKVLLDG